MRHRFSVVGLLLVALALCACEGGSSDAAEILDYAEGAGPNELILTVASGLADTEGAAEVISQDEDAIVVKATIRKPTAPVEDVRIFIQIPVSLKQPVGDREVVDVDGREIPRK
ncbi:hypothetical protein [uncultured Arthrobacter sp.]|uniref:hypothetical protein n=1 Tax=uncultured Arthrobacter sp. TaxID=114050 RepID=UPI00262E2AAB|nr:hypothetical protein [uncultured Arthrobacter sp.]